MFIVVQANEALAVDDCCQWELASASIDGVKVRQPDTGNLFAFVGVADAAISANAFGLVQVYGYRSTSRVFQTDTSQNTGVALVPTAAQVYLQSVATTIQVSSTIATTVTLQPIFAVLGETVSNSAASATTTAKVFIRAL
ncbi:MAG: hypothetical protein HY323_09155 [Betaproteobacteria bacterium]|nr:hypothetical protein [Betaproteobacteria bacterium]